MSDRVINMIMQANPNGHVVMRLKDLQGFIRRFPQDGGSVATALAFLTKACVQEQALAGRDLVEGVFIEKTDEKYPFVLMMMSAEQVVQDAIEEITQEPTEQDMEKMAGLVDDIITKAQEKKS